MRPYSRAALILEEKKQNNLLIYLFVLYALHVMLKNNQHHWNSDSLSLSFNAALIRGRHIFEDDAYSRTGFISKSNQNVRWLFEGRAY